MMLHAPFFFSSGPPNKVVTCIPSLSQPLYQIAQDVQDLVESSNAKESMPLQRYITREHTAEPLWEAKFQTSFPCSSCRSPSLTDGLPLPCRSKFLILLTQHFELEFLVCIAL